MGNIGDRFRAAREARGLTLRQLAEACNYAVSTVSGVENNQHAPSARYIQDFALALGVRIQWLTGIDNDEMFEPLPELTPTAVALDTLKAISDENASLREELKLGVARCDAIDARVRDLKKLIKGEVRVVARGWKLAEAGSEAKPDSGGDGPHHE